MNDKTTGIIFLSLLCLPIVTPIVSYVINGYPIVQIDGILARAQSVNRLEDVADYAEEALEKLEPYTGNPQWLFPTDETDMDLIKNDLQIIITQVREQADNLTIGTDSYQEALDNAYERIDIIRDQLYYGIKIYGCTFWLTWNPIVSLIFWGSIIGFIIFLIKIHYNE